MVRRNPFETRKEREERRKREWQEEVEWRRKRAWEERVKEARKGWPSLYAMVETERFASWYRKVTGEDFSWRHLDSPFAVEARVEFALKKSRQRKRLIAAGIEVRDGKASLSPGHKRRIMQRLATPPWVDREKIRDIYAERDRINEQLKGEGSYDVDHIVPIMGENVCGLHWHLNLRVIPASENRRKKNSFDEFEYFRETG